MFKIVKDSEKSLREKCKDVPLPLREEDEAFVHEMMDYLKRTQDPKFREKHPTVREGVGLAAPQVGRNIKAIVIYYPLDQEGKEHVELELVNPRIVSNSIRKAYLSGGEGCLSVDGEHPGHVIRDYKIKVKAFDAKEKKEVELVARGYDAIVLQHEIDHLSGILYYDRISKTDPFQDIPNAYVI